MQVVRSTLPIGIGSTLPIGIRPTLPIGSALREEAYKSFKTAGVTLDMSSNESRVVVDDQEQEMSALGFCSGLPGMIDAHMVEEFTGLAVALKRKSATLTDVCRDLEDYFDGYADHLETRLCSQMVSLEFNEMLNIMTVPSEDEEMFEDVSGVLCYEVQDMWCHGTDVLGVVMSLEENHGGRVIESQTFFRDPERVYSDGGFMLTTNPFPKISNFEIFCISLLKCWERVDIPPIPSGDDNDTDDAADASVNPRASHNQLFIARDLPFACLLFHFLTRNPIYSDRVVEVLVNHFGSQYVVERELASLLLQHHANLTEPIRLARLQLSLQAVWTPGSASGSLSHVKTSLFVTHVV